MAEKTVEWKMYQRQGTASEWESKNPVLAAGEFGYDTTNDKLKIGDGSTAWNSLPTISTTRFSFATASWGDIANVAAAGSAKKYFNVGDEKTITLTTGEEVTLVILGFDHDDLTAGGKAPITIGMKNCLATKYPMNSSNTNAGGWDESVMRTSTMATLLAQLPSDLQNVIKYVDKKATAGSQSTAITTSSDKLFLFARAEIYTLSTAGYVDEGEQYEYWSTIKDGSTAADRIKYLSNGDGSAYPWWLRSPSASYSTNFSYIASTGAVSIGYAGSSYGVSFGFCI